jgi:hypothetical protein
MKIKYFKDFYMLNYIENHKSFNKKLLHLIDKIKDNSFITQRDHISKTDWNLSRETPREYLDYFYKIITPYMNKMSKLLQEKKWTIWNGWFQQYYTNDFHTWHRHAKVNWTNIYYIELPSKSMFTKIKNPFTEKVTNIKAKEGMLVTMPGHVLHTSPKFKSDKRKTIISFNSCFHD